jgi:hypothetical protein
MWPDWLKKKWATFTYTSPQIRKVTNIFKHTDINITFKCYNTIAQLTKPARDIDPSSPMTKVVSTRSPV